MSEETSRRAIAVQAAQLIAEGGLDYRRAKQRAAQDLFGDRVPRSAMPDNAQIDEALREHLDLFDGPAHAERVAALRRVALELMQRLERWHPHVTGAAWKGIATEHALLHLQLFADDPKEVMIGLINLGFDPEPADAPGVESDAHVEAMAIEHSGMTVLVAVHDRDGQRTLARTGDDGQPMRATRAQLLARMNTPH